MIVNAVKVMKQKTEELVICALLITEPIRIKPYLNTDIHHVAILPACIPDSNLYTVGKLRKFKYFPFNLRD